MSAPLTLDQVNDKIARIIRAQGPISIRKICHHFAAKHHIHVRGMIGLWAQQGSLIVTGSGRRNNPLVVRVKDSVTQ